MGQNKVTKFLFGQNTRGNRINLMERMPAFPEPCVEILEPLSEDAAQHIVLHKTIWARWCGKDFVNEICILKERMYVSQLLFYELRETKAVR